MGFLSGGIFVRWDFGKWDFFSGIFKWDFFRWEIGMHPIETVCPTTMYKPFMSRSADNDKHVFAMQIGRSSNPCFL